MKKILWFSRHQMTQEQMADLNKAYGVYQIISVDGTVPNVHVPFQGSLDGGEIETLPPFKELMATCDIVAIVAPIGIQEQIMKVRVDDQPILIPRSKRERVETSEGEEPKFEFIHEKWIILKKIEIVTEDLL